ncbi:hypothetical protein EK21DRAFT_94399 [Setomelanomma holmii]|uniref:Uncharacterized protein n=1 Tax=Setomelanomma holmii TaxID=210430 RepID=A0A9P4LG87_9PLEO|nr:hypothetical protein EK21DRAFT_94399 [Setomelanomma holmii]
MGSRFSFDLLIKPSSDASQCSSHISRESIAQALVADHLTVRSRGEKPSSQSALRHSTTAAETTQRSGRITTLLSNSPVVGRPSSEEQAPIDENNGQHRASHASGGRTQSGTSRSLPTNPNATPNNPQVRHLAKSLTATPTISRRSQYDDTQHTNQIEASVSPSNNSTPTRHIPMMVTSTPKLVGPQNEQRGTEGRTPTRGRPR